MKRKIAVFTGTRAEYGLLRSVIKKLASSPKLDVLLVCTGAHLSEKHGYTVTEIENDGVEIAAKIDILKFGNDAFATAKTVAYAIDAFSEWLHANKPDGILLLGDRYEAFAAASAAAMLQIPIAHISGGDVTLGAHDEYFRHCITKMAAIHFPACQSSAQRLVQLGESPESIYCVGGLGDENLRATKLLTKEQLSESINVNLDNPYALITFHPETAGNVKPHQQMTELLDALQHTNLTLIFTKANADAGGVVINDMLDVFCAQHKNSYAFQSLGMLRYLSAMKYAACVIGNSSSGVVETPTLGVPCVNIGDRQKGRIITSNVVCCAAKSADILNAINNCTGEAFSKIAKYVQSPYHGGNTSEKIVSHLEDFFTSSHCNDIKSFYDIKTKEGTL